MRTRMKTSSRLPRQSSRIIDLVPSLLHIRRILVPVDFSPPSKKALRYALSFAEQFGARITVMHVLDEPSPELAFEPLEKKRLMQSSREAAEKKMKQLMASDDTKVSVYKGLVSSGRAYQEITEAARRQKVDLIVLATHGWTGLKHVVMGSTAEKVIRHAPCPVLVVREKETDFV